MSGPLSDAFLNTGNSSFTKFLSEHAPELLASKLQVPAGKAEDNVRHGTTILAVTYADGAIIAADRQVTSGSSVSSRYGEKILPADDYTCIGTAGTAALGMQMARLFQVELEHYEKIEGVSLSFEGKTNFLSRLLADNLAMAMQGLSVVPLFSGYDVDSGKGRIFSYDPIGGRHEEFKFHSVGSGSIFAQGTLKKLHRDQMSEEDAIFVCLQALYDASDDDIYTMGSDLSREIFPIVFASTAEGNRQLTDEEVGTRMRQVVESRLREPDGPKAPPR